MCVATSVRLPDCYSEIQNALHACVPRQFSYNALKLIPIEGEIKNICFLNFGTNFIFMDFYSSVELNFTPTLMGVFISI